jgi:hypothetical protein
MRAHVRAVASVRWLMLAGILVPLALAALLPGARALRAAPATRHVASCADSGPGSLRAAIAASAPGDTVAFDRDCTIALASALTIPSALDLTIDALSPARAVTLDGGGAVQLLALQATDNRGPAVNVSGLTFRNGRSSGAGGAIFNDQGTLTVTRSTFVGNQAATGGGAIENAGGTLSVTNSTFVDNRVVGTFVATGGAIDNNASGRVAIASSTFTGNAVSSTAAQSSAGGALFDFSATPGSLALTASIVAGNTGGNCGGADIASANPAVASGGRNVVGVNGTGACGPDFAGLTDGANGDRVGTQAAPLDAKLGPLGDYGGTTRTVPLLPGSPALDAGACPGGVAVDQRGIARPQGAACDAGAFESRGVQSLAVAATGGGAGVKVGATAQFAATGTFDGGGTADVSARAAWSSDNAAILTVDSTGKATGVSPGTAHVAATVDGATGEAAVAVTAGTPAGVAPAPAPAGRPGAAGGGAATASAAPAPAPRGGTGGQGAATAGGETATATTKPAAAPPSR